MQARSQTTGSVVPVGEIRLPESPIELYYDIEGEPNLDMDYLHGLLIVEHGKEPQYLAFLAEQPENEGPGCQTEALKLGVMNGIMTISR